MQTTLTRIFIDLESVSDGLSENWAEISRKARKLQRFFRRKLDGLQKKKGLHRKWEWFFGRNLKFKGFFRPKLGGLQKKKKKGLHRNWEWFFVQFRKFRCLRGGCSPMGGAIFSISQKIGLKSTKNMQFCILHKPMGGTRAPPRPPWLRYCIEVEVTWLDKEYSRFKTRSVSSFCNHVFYSVFFFFFFLNLIFLFTVILTQLVIRVFWISFVMMTFSLILFQ